MNSFTHKLNGIAFDIVYAPGEPEFKRGHPDNWQPGTAPEIDYGMSTITVRDQTVQLTWQLWELLGQHTREQLTRAMYRDETRRDAEAAEEEAAERFFDWSAS